MKLILFIARIVKKNNRHHISAFAAQAAFFILLSVIPFLLLLLTLVQYTPLTQADIIKTISQVFPDNIYPAVVSIVDEIYSKSSAVIPLTAVSAIWASGKGVLALTNGLNCINEIQETRNYFMLRVRSAFYTILFLITIILSLLLLVFGNSIYLVLEKNLPVLANMAKIIISLRTIILLVILAFLFLLIYTFVPNKKTKMKLQMPGALFSAVCWSVFSFGYSIYVDSFSGASKIYGSLTTVVLGLLWLYFCMYLLLLGAEVNMTIQEQKEESI